MRELQVVYLIEICALAGTVAAVKVKAIAVYLIEMCALAGTKTGVAALLC